MEDRRPNDEDFAGVLRRNIEALRQERSAEQSKAGLEERVAAGITAFAGSMVFVYIHAAALVAWISINLGWLPLVKPFDKSFVILAMVASVEAIFLSTFILISQNRAASSDQRRADLNLQMSLLAEHEVTQLIKMVSALGRRLEIAEASDPSLEPLKRDVRPEDVLQQLDE